MAKLLPPAVTVSEPSTPQRSSAQPNTSPSGWADRLDRLAAPALLDFPAASDPDRARADFIRDFRDDLGHRRETDAPFIAAALGAEPPPWTARLPPPAAVRAWTAIARGKPLDHDLRALIERVTSREAARLDARDARELCGLTPDATPPGIEPVTEALLCLADAVWHGARTGSTAWAPDAAGSLRDHLLDEYQPDNATGHPWAIGLFLDDWCVNQRTDSLMYADGMLSACQIALGRPDRLSAVILRYAATRLRQ